MRGNRMLPIRDVLDRVGMASSLVCAVHCAVLPLLVGLVPLVGASLFEDRRTEWAFVAISFAVGITSLLPSYFSKHRKARPLMLFVIGLGSILTARTIFEDFHRAEIPFVLFGACFVITAHLLNRKLCRACEVCQDDCA